MLAIGEDLMDLRFVICDLRFVIMKS